MKQNRRTYRLLVTGPAGGQTLRALLKRLLRHFRLKAVTVKEIIEGEKSSGKESSSTVVIERQSNRPRCRKCNLLMHAVMSANPLKVSSEAEDGSKRRIRCWEILFGVEQMT